MEYISIRNWEKFQHYGDRNPPWIKLHQSLFRDYDYAKLNDESKLLLISLFLLASITGNKIPNDPEWVRVETKIQGKIDFQPLFDTRFLLSYNASKRLALEEKRREEKSITPPAVSAFRGATHRYPAKSWFDDIDSAVGDNPETVMRWRELCKEWVGRGWNPVNVKGMLEAFKNGGIKGKNESTYIPTSEIKEFD